ncbi:hypothetical protein ElyMa_000132700 [Elysia marginata]|uniref:Uncharacterized protein n=1 Tax=Elysia marginata TaxID=1093978 RepID=A0AAV4EPB7_9GAST|nr:hypothetical protein ElyMa_000132700 [Elysia marginata]
MAYTYSETDRDIEKGRKRSRQAGREADRLTVTERYVDWWYKRNRREKIEETLLQTPIHQHHDHQKHHPKQHEHDQYHHQHQNHHQYHHKHHDHHQYLRKKLGHL